MNGPANQTTWPRGQFGIRITQTTIPLGGPLAAIEPSSSAGLTHICQSALGRSNLQPECLLSPRDRRECAA